MKINQRGSGLIMSLVNLVFGLIVALVGLRFLFILLGANSDSSLVGWIYANSAPLVAPFSGVFPAIDGSRIDMESLLALVVYGIIATLLSRLFIGNSHVRSS